MSIGISEEHVELAASLRRWAMSLDGPAVARAAEDEAGEAFADTWKAVSEMGAATIGLPESVGGGGGGVLDQAVALEVCAHALVPGPLLGPAVAAALLGETDGVAEQIGSGAVVALALGGTVWDLPSATHVLRPDDEDRWSVVPAGALPGEPAAGIDLTRRFGTLPSTAAAAEAEGAVPVAGLTSDLVRRTAVTLAAAEASGLARWCLATAVEHAKVREQFGRPIGSFQAVKHLCAEMLETAEAVTAAAWDVAAVAFADDDQWAFAADVAEVTCFDGAVEVAKACIQVLGGTGFTFEHDAHLYLRRALTLRALLGRSDRAAARLAHRAVDGVRRRVEVDLEGRDEQVRSEVRATVERIAGAGDVRAALVETGYLTPHWPEPAGLGADPVLQLVIDQELARAGVARPDIVIAGWALPTILEHGTPEQRERFVRPSLLGDLVWCQLFSEPGSGSDLASLRTRAERVEGGWRLSGQKVWTSVAERADWGICLARTDPDAPAAPRHQLLPGRHALTGHRRATAAGDHRGGAVQRGLPRRRPGPRRLPGGRARRGLAARPHHPGQRAGGDGDQPARQEHRARGDAGGRRRPRPQSGGGRRPGRGPLDGVLAARGADHPALAGRPGPGCGVERGQAARGAQPPGRRRAGAGAARRAGRGAGG